MTAHQQPAARRALSSIVRYLHGISAAGKVTDSDLQVAGQTIRPMHFALMAGAAFGLYWLSSLILQARDATTHFGADTWYYAELRQGDVFRRIATNYYLDRITRFHPTTIAMAASWMKLFEPLTPWIAPINVLKAMFAAVGAVGVWAALSAFAAVIPRRYVMLLGSIYAISLGVWYFAGIEESKIVTATLSALYIAIYLQLRERWTRRGAILLTAVLLLACLNEMVSGFLVLIPLVDTLMRRGWDWRHGWWIAAHALAGPLALVILEGIIFGRLVGSSHPEGSTHLGMLLSYISRNTYSVANFYSFVVNWLFFNIAAPTPDASYAVPVGATYKGYFEPALVNYFSSVRSAGVATLFGVMIVASLLPRYRPDSSGNHASILLGLAAYTLVRGAFFYTFNPFEPLLFSPAVTLAHMLMIGIPFAASKFPAKGLLLAAFAVLLFVNNGGFIIGK